MAEVICRQIRVYTDESFPLSGGSSTRVLAFESDPYRAGLENPGDKGINWHERKFIDGFGGLAERVASFAVVDNEKVDIYPCNSFSASVDGLPYIEAREDRVRVVYGGNEDIYGLRDLATGIIGSYEGALLVRQEMEKKIAIRREADLQVRSRAVTRE